MRRVGRAVILSVVLALAACSNNSITAPVDSAFTLGVGESATVRGAGLSVKFVQVTEDSRCPSSVVCVWEGNGRIAIEVRHDGTTVPYVLNTSQGAKEVVVGTFRIKLEELKPAPVNIAPIPAGSYRATLTVHEAGTVCTQEARPGLTIALKDKITGATSGFTNVAVVAREGAYADSVAMATYPDLYASGIALVYERRGTYDVTVRADGYVPWVRNGIVVTGDQCHVVTQSFTALLER